MRRKMYVLYAWKEGCRSHPFTGGRRVWGGNGLFGSDDCGKARKGVNVPGSKVREVPFERLSLGQARGGDRTRNQTMEWPTRLFSSALPFELPLQKNRRPLGSLTC